MLDTLEVPGNGPVIVTICGDAGLGKTTLGASFPDPVFIQAEEGLRSIPMEDRPKAFPLIQSPDDLFSQMKSLLTEEHDFKTLVIDSVSTLDTMFAEYVVDKDPKNPKSINQANGGYGNGWAEVAAMHQRVRRGADMLKNKRGMNVVFLAHANTETIDLPDQEPYTTYTLQMNKRSVQTYKNKVDLVGFLKLQTFTTGDGDRKKAISDGTRVLVTYTTAANVSKNRFGITGDLEVTQGENPLIEYIPELAV